MYIVVEQYVRYLQNGVEYTVARLECDTIADLPLPTGSYKPGVGSKAHVVEDNSWWAYKSTDQWVLQEAGTSAYTKAEVDAIIASLDATSVGGSGKYIQSIYETDGIIYATPATIQTSVNTSSNAVSSNAVKTYVDNGLSDKITIADVFSTGVSLANYNSLDNLTPGNYYAENGTVAGNVNAPYTRSGFNLWVIATNNTTRRVQLLFPNPNGSEYNTKSFFLLRQEVAGTWEAWHTITDFHGLGNSTLVGAAGINMDTLKTEGVWYSASTTGAQASTGRPDYDFAGAKVWRLDVYRLYSTRSWQELTVYRLGSSEGDFDKYFRINKTDDTWTDWQHVDTTTVGTYYPVNPNLQGLDGNMRSSAPNGQEEIIVEQEER